MAIQPILRLGHPGLRARCAPARHVTSEIHHKVVRDLQDTLDEFRTTHGFGRGIAAPQIGVEERIIVLRLDEPLVLVNPLVTRRSRRRMTLWDDCFSFPDLLVKVRRHLEVDVGYQDLSGRHHVLHAEGALSELLQHEIDHLDGVLAIDRAIDSRHIVYKSEYERWKTHGEVIL